MTETLLEPQIFTLLLVVSIPLGLLVVGLGIGLGYGLRDRVSGVSLSRAGGLQIRTNDVVMWSKLKNAVEQIDASTRKTIRKATTGLMILSPDKYTMSAEVMLVNRAANSPLVYAAYENHHTRELAADGIDAYIADKANDITEAVRIWKKHFPELTDEACYDHACLWIQKILIPNLRRACHAKLAYYESMDDREDVGKIVKMEILRCVKKNMGYVKRIDELAARPDIKNFSSIINPPQAL
jgi:hypothetical protein